MNVQELQISEYIGLRSKSCSVVRADEQVIKKVKGKKICNQKTLKTTKMHFITKNNIHIK